MEHLPLEDMERKLEELARKWERYFAGDREVPIPPERERAALSRQLTVLSRTEGIPTAVRFRLDGLLHRFATYNQLWERQLKSRNEARRAADILRATSVNKKEGEREEDDEAVRLHRQYLAALAKVGKQAKVELESFRRVMAEQKRRLESQGFEVREFTVVCEGDKVSLRARARKKEGA